LLRVFDDRHRPPLHSAGDFCWGVAVAVATFNYLEIRRDLAENVYLTLLSSRAGLVVEPGSKVTYNGVQIGRVSRIAMVDRHGTPVASLTLDVYPAYLRYIPANVTVDIEATTVFGNEFISLVRRKTLHRRRSRLAR